MRFRLPIKTASELSDAVEATRFLSKLIMTPRPRLIERFNTEIGCREFRRALRMILWLLRDFESAKVEVDAELCPAPNENAPAE